MFRFLSTGKRLEHPIIIIFTAIFLITWEAWLDWSFKLILFDLALTRDSFLRHSSKLIFVIVGASSGVAFSWTHQPFINFLISLKNALIVWSAIVWTKCPLLCNNKVDLGNYWTIATRVFTSRGGRLCLKLWVLWVRGAWSFCSDARDRCTLGSRLL
jgi:hypothetical protein